jgi:hypothetical protein
MQVSYGFTVLTFIFYQNKQSRLITAIGKLTVAHIANEFFASYWTRRLLTNLTILLILCNEFFIEQQKGKQSRRCILRASLSDHEHCELHVSLVRKPEGKRSLGKPRRRWLDNIRLGLGEVGRGYVDWIGLAQDWDRDSSCGCGNEPSGSRKCWEPIEWLHNWCSLE